MPEIVNPKGNLSAISWLSRNKGLTSHRDWLHWSLASIFPEGPLESSSVVDETSSKEDHEQGGL